MNRKQRRSKPRKIRFIDKELAWKKISFAVQSSVGQPEEQAELDNFQMTWESALNTLRFGTMTADDYKVLSIMLIIGTELAELIGQHDKTGQIIEVGNGYQVYGKALFDIGERFEKTNKYVATGGELAMLTEAKNTNMELLMLANQSHILKASQKTGQIYASMMRKFEKEVRNVQISHAAA